MANNNGRDLAAFFHRWLAAAKPHQTHCKPAILNGDQTDNGLLSLFWVWDDDGELAARLTLDHKTVWERAVGGSDGAEVAAEGVDRWYALGGHNWLPA